MELGVSTAWGMRDGASIWSERVREPAERMPGYWNRQRIEGRGFVVQDLRDPTAGL
jgi:hypothetical protein